MRHPLHITLLGDSVFANANYVAKDQDLIHQLEKLLGRKDACTLMARDGAMIPDIQQQLREMPLETTHMVISVGGNDALMSAGWLLNPQEQVRPKRVLDVLNALTRQREFFAAAYLEMVERCMSKKLPLVLCTIHHPVFEGRDQRHAVMLLSLFNDSIISIATTHGLPVLDLRWLSSSRDDYANEIEPSAQGSTKTAFFIKTICTVHDFKQLSRTYGAECGVYKVIPFWSEEREVASG